MGLQLPALARSLGYSDADDAVKQVTLSVQADDDLFSVETGEAAMTFTGPSDQIAMLRLRATHGAQRHAARGRPSADTKSAARARWRHRGARGGA